MLCSQIILETHPKDKNAKKTGSVRTSHAPYPSLTEFLTDQYTDIRAADCAFFQPADRPRDVSVFRNLQFDRLIHAEPSQGTSHPIQPQEIS